MLAAADAVVPERTLELAVGVRVRIAGLAEQLAPALIEGDAVARTEIVAWSGEPSPPVWDTDEEHYSAGQGVQVLRSRDTLRLHAGDRGALWVRDPGVLTRWETAAPLRTLLRWALRDHGLHMVHGAAVVGPRGAAVLAGPSGAGKSTTALAAAQAGLGFVADDYCAVALGGPVVHALCGVGKLAEPWPGLRVRPRRADARRQAARRPARADPRSVIGLDRAAARRGRRAAARAGPPRRGAQRAGDVALLLPGSSQDDLAALGGLARSLPAHRLVTGPDPRAAAAVLAEHLA